MRQIRKLHKVNTKQVRCSISDAMLEDLGWNESAELIGEIEKDNQLVVIKDEKKVRCRLNKMPRYNALTLPRVWGEKYNKNCRLESKDGKLIIQFFE